MPKFLSFRFPTTRLLLFSCLLVLPVYFCSSHARCILCGIHSTHLMRKMRTHVLFYCMGFQRSINLILRQIFNSDQYSLHIILLVFKNLIQTYRNRLKAVNAVKGNPIKYIYLFFNCSNTFITTYFLKYHIHSIYLKGIMFLLIEYVCVC